MEHFDTDQLTDMLQYINPAGCSYQEWINIGAALKHEGIPCSIWDDWSKADHRYKSGECYRKWASFNRDSGDVVTGGTIYDMAKRGGWTPKTGTDKALSWDDEIGTDKGHIDPGWVESEDFAEPKDWEPVNDLIRYLDALYHDEDHVGYVTESFRRDDGRYAPGGKGVFSRTKRDIVHALKTCGGDIGRALGDADPQAGAWIRFNPLDGYGIKNDNVSDYRFALIESDQMELGQQVAMIKQLELPVAAMVYSGGKSVHAIIRINANDYDDYRKRVNFLYDFCKKNGMAVDTQNKNPSRLSRMPGFMRGNHKQFLIGTSFGKESWDEWKAWADEAGDDLPDMQQLSAVWDNMPPLSPELISGVLRQGHKMLISGPSKAGKSFLLTELCIAIAEGKEWIGMQCAQGKVLYVNLEIDEATIFRRFREVYDALGLQPDHIANIDVWNLRGHSVPMDKLAPILIHRCEEKGYMAVVIDPIYKVITGDENSASEMAYFCNQFDRICVGLHCAVIYSHHHAKGLQGTKRTMDRASGSGVFARDPDALLDMSELEMDKACRAKYRSEKYCAAAEDFMDAHGIRWRKDRLASDILPGDRAKIDEIINRCVPEDMIDSLYEATSRAENKADSVTAFRIDGVLREFAPFAHPIDVFFEHPIHVLDTTNIMADVKIAANMSKSERGVSGHKKAADNRKSKVRDAFYVISESGHAKLNDIADYTNFTAKTVRKYFEEFEDFGIDNGIVFEKEKT